MRRELKHKIAYLKLGPTDNIYTYDFDKELSFLQSNFNTRKNTWAIYCWNNNCGFVDVCCWHHNDHKKKSSNIGNLSWKKFVFSHPIHRAGVFLSCLFQFLYSTVLSISAYSLDVIDMLFLTLRWIICQFGMGKYLQHWNMFRLRHFKTNSTQFEDPIYFSWLSLEAFALKANNCLHIRMAYSFYKNTYS